LRLALVLELFSPSGLQAIGGGKSRYPAKQALATISGFLEQFDRYLATITPAVAFPAGARPLDRPPHRRAQLPARRAAFRGARRLSRRRGRRPAGLGLRRPRRAGPGTPPGNALSSTTWPTCCAMPSIRASNSSATANRWPQPAQLRAAGHRAGRAADPGRQHPRKTDHFRGRRPQQPTHRAALRALPRFGLCRLPHRAGDQGETTRKSSPCSAAAGSIPNCANSRSRAFSIISTTSRSMTASAPLLACSSTSTASARASIWAAPMPA
jgi:hypothetical protein